MKFFRKLSEISLKIRYVFLKTEWNFLNNTYVKFSLKWSENLIFTQLVKLVADDSQEVSEMCSPHENMREIERV